MVSTEKPKGKRDLSKIECWNCGKMGHFSSKCKEPKKSKDQKSTSKSDSKKEGTSAAAVNSSSDDEGAWVAEEIEDGGADWFAEVVKVSESETSCESGESDWFEEAVSETDLEMLRNPSSCLNFGSPDDRLRVCVSEFVEDDLPDLQYLSDSEDDDVDEEELLSWDSGGVRVEDLLDASGEVFMVAKSIQAAGVAELYNSGCTNHISPYRNQLVNFQGTKPHHFCAVNKQTFSMTGKGELVVDVPNGQGSTQLHLHDVLFSAEVGYMLVSVGRLDEPGFTVIFGGGKCILKGEDDVDRGGGKNINQSL